MFLKPFLELCILWCIHVFLYVYIMYQVDWRLPWWCVIWIILPLDKKFVIVFVIGFSMFDDVFSYHSASGWAQLLLLLSFLLLLMCIYSWRRCFDSAYVCTWFFLLLIKRLHDMELDAAMLVYEEATWSGNLYSTWLGMCRKNNWCSHNHTHFLIINLICWYFCAYVHHHRVLFLLMYDNQFDHPRTH